MKCFRFALLLLLCIFLLKNNVVAQENVAPLLWNGVLSQKAAGKQTVAARGTALTLPFFEDFTDDSPYPNMQKWADSNVYINNTMGRGVISRGVATFDALNKYGRPYDTTNRYAQTYADSLTSQPFDLNNYAPGDSIYLSFFFQPQGNGFSPEPGDSLCLFFLNSLGRWHEVWNAGGSSVLPFKQVMIPVTDTGFLHNNFRFRFVNKATINTNDDVWNIDYIRMSLNRNINDTGIYDLAFTCNQTNLLAEYTSLPYRHYLANSTAERTNTFADSIVNYYATMATVNYGFTAKETTTGTPLAANGTTLNIPIRTATEVIFNAITATPTAPSVNTKMVFEVKSYLQSGNPNEPKDNDTLLHRQVFDNYFAYDDGSAEKSYFLTQGNNLTAKLAIEFHSNIPDTLGGIAICFGQQVPTAVSKPMSIVAYKSLAGIDGATKDSVITKVNECFPVYTDSVNKFTYYRFSSPVLMDTGTFYIGYIQPANSGSDSIYIGLDVNRVGGNHVYYNTLAAWTSSTVSGALLIRPLMGTSFVATNIQTTEFAAVPNWSFYPNPAHELIQIVANNGLQPQLQTFSIKDITGKQVLIGEISDNPINVSSLLSGMYFLQVFTRDGITAGTKKIIIQ